MKQSVASVLVVLVCALAAGAGCGSSKPSLSTVSDAGMPDALTKHPVKMVDAGVDAAGSVLAIPSSCEGSLPPPSSLECTGLYTDMALKTLAPQVRAYAPAVPLWADGSGKSRWIYFPPGQQIDTTNPSEWTFPVGTRVWKEFSRDGVRVETRFFEKLAAGSWAYGTYAWSSDETSATLAPGGNEITLPDGQLYYIPTFDECGECHGGRLDKLMGFEEVSLGQSGATGMTLEELVAENLLTTAPASTHLQVGDDGTGLAAAPLSWLHINCGVSCHNTNPSALASGAGMVLRLDPTELNGSSAKSYPSLLTTVGVAATGGFTGTRIDPGSPAGSILYQLINERGMIQMPPIASLYVDTPDVAAVAAWISAMAPGPVMDAGADAARDSGVDAMRSDASMRDGSTHDGSMQDGGMHDGGAHDAKPADAAEDGASKDGSSKDGAAADGGDAASDAAKD